MSVRIGVLLCGCGVFDGSEIHEAVSVLIALDRRGAEAVCIAPASDQSQNISHLSQKPADKGIPARNMLEESARIARGNIRDLENVNADDFDALIIPGGFGVIKNLCTFAVDGTNCKVLPAVERLVLAMHSAKKPIGLTCIAPVLAARILGKAGIKARLTIGTDQDTAAAIDAMGCLHQETGTTGIIVDHENRLVSTPCYMNDVGPWVVFQGAEKMVEQVLNLAGDPDSLHRQSMATFR